MHYNTEVLPFIYLHALWAFVDYSEQSTTLIYEINFHLFVRMTRALFFSFSLSLILRFVYKNPLSVQTMVVSHLATTDANFEFCTILPDMIVRVDAGNRGSVFLTLLYLLSP
jgi:hypothetical protein